MEGRKHRVNRRNKNLSSVWTCTNLECPGSVTWSDAEERILRQVAHTCSPDFEAFKRDEIISELRHLATIGAKPLKRVIEDCLERYRCNPEYENVVPTFQEVRNVCYRARTRNLQKHLDC